MHQVWTGGLQSEHAVPEMGPISTEAHAEQRESTPNWRSAQDHAECGEDSPDGPFGGTEISCHDQAAAGRSSSENSAVSADHWQQDEWRTVEHTAQHLLSLHLAACPLYTETTDAAEKQSWETTPENAVRDPRDDQVKKLVRVLMNTTGTACYINAFMVALSWCTLLTHSLTSNVWQLGFELMRGLTQWSCVPLNVQLFPPFRWLLTGVWSDDELLAQQDIIEFGSILLSRLQPTFISCRWTTRVQHVTKEVDTHLDSENGPRYSPILIRFSNMHESCSHLSDLITLWHDPLGLCRAADQARDCILLMLDRHDPEQNTKCLQRVDIDEGLISFPCLMTDDGDIEFIEYVVVAISFHVGAGPQSGHHRTAVRYRQQWLVYDDNRLPDIIPHLTCHILQNSTLIWLVKCTPFVTRNIAERPGTGLEIATSAQMAHGTFTVMNASAAAADIPATEGTHFMPPPADSSMSDPGSVNSRAPLDLRGDDQHGHATDLDATLTQDFKRARTADVTTPCGSMSSSPA